MSHRVTGGKYQPRTHAEACMQMHALACTFPFNHVVSACMQICVHAHHVDDVLDLDCMHAASTFKFSENIWMHEDACSFWTQIEPRE